MQPDHFFHRLVPLSTDYMKEQASQEQTHTSLPRHHQDIREAPLHTPFGFLQTPPEQTILHPPAEPCMNRAEHLASGRQLYTAYAQEFRERIVGGYLAELLPYPHFVVWRQETVSGVPKKPPYNPNRPGQRADVSAKTGEDTWGTWQEALSALSTGY